MDQEAQNRERGAQQSQRFSQGQHSGWGGGSGWGAVTVIAGAAEAIALVPVALMVVALGEGDR